MPNYSTPGHPFGSQSIHVTVNPAYSKTKQNRYESTEYRDLKRPKTSWKKESPREDEASQAAKSSSPPRAKTAPPAAGLYRTMPPLNKNKKLITLRLRQVTPWCRDMYKWFTPEPKMGVWHDKENLDRYRVEALRQRTPANCLYHVDRGLMPSYSGYVPGQKFRYGATWARETVNANSLGLPRYWESTSLFENRPLGV